MTRPDVKPCHMPNCDRPVELSARVGFPRRRRLYCAPCAFLLGEDLGVVEEGSAIRVGYPAQVVA